MTHQQNVGIFAMPQEIYLSLKLALLSCPTKLYCLRAIPESSWLQPLHLISYQNLDIKSILFLSFSLFYLFIFQSFIIIDLEQQPLDY